MNHSHQGQIPPQDTETERAVLSMIINEGKAADSVTDILTPETFYHPTHRLIYEQLCQLAAMGYPADIMSLSAQLRHTGIMNQIGGMNYLFDLGAVAVSSANIMHLACVLKEKHLKREQIRLAGELMKMAYSTDDVFETFESIEQQLFNLSGVQSAKGLMPMAKVAEKVLKTIAEVRACNQDLTGAPAGFRDLDRHTNGWQPTDLIVVAARPGVGKTAFSLNLAYNAATDLDKPTAAAIFNLEMEDTQVARRGMAAQSGIPLKYISRPKLLHAGEIEALQDTTNTLRNIPVYIEDTPALTTAQLRSKMRRYISKYKIGVVIIDYLQLITCGKKAQNRENEISQVSRDLKIIAKELKVPIIALSQLNRDIEKRTSKEPTLADLRESGAIEQDADVILFLYRPSEDLVKQDGSLEDKVVISCKKNRNGELFDTVLQFDKKIQLFTDTEEVGGGDGWERR